MFDKSITGNQEKRQFDELEAEKLGKYVYALRDPRDGKIFYVGQGIRNRLFDHFKEADDCLLNNKIASSKTIRILDIWKNEEDVDWIIISRNLEDDQADYIESSVFNVLSVSQNGKPLNETVPPKSSLLTKDDIQALAAQPVNPAESLDRVFLFPIQNAIAKGRSVYEATRRSWYVKSFHQTVPAFAVGIRNGISIGSFSIKRWNPIENKHEFVGEEYPSLLGKNWSRIISCVKGYWQRGNYIIVKFDGKGKFSIVRGAGQEKQWLDCISDT